MTITRGADVELLDTPGRNRTGALATASRGAREVGVYRQRQMPGGANPAHTHDREEVMVVTAGRVTVTVGDERFEIGSGDTVIVPARTLHRIENGTDEPAEWLLVAPAGTRFFGENGAEMTPAWAR